MRKLAHRNPQKVIDLLTERLTFERAAVKLYDAILFRVQTAPELEVRKTYDQLLEYREQEKEHEEWLEQQIRLLGGDAHGMTELAELVETESAGLEKVIIDGDPAISHLFHALLTAELADNAGWALLVDLADEAEDLEARRAFARRLHEEEEHQAFIRRTVQRSLRRQVLGELASP
jgi:bacterioferritin (cytochrome b1)